MNSEADEGAGFALGMHFLSVGERLQKKKGMAPHIHLVMILACVNDGKNARVKIRFPVIIMASEGRRNVCRLNNRTGNGHCPLSLGL